MARISSKAGQEEPFTQIPNRVIRSSVLDPYEMRILCILMSCNPSFPTYPTLTRWGNMSRGKVHKALVRLEGLGLIYRFPRGQCVEYFTIFDERIPKETRKQLQFRCKVLDEAGPSSPSPLTGNCSDPPAGYFEEIYRRIRSSDELPSESMHSSGELEDPSETSTPGVLVNSEPVHHVYSTSTPRVLRPVHVVYSKKNKEKEQRKSEETFADEGILAERIAEAIRDRAKERK